MKKIILALFVFSLGQAHAAHITQTTTGSPGQIGAGVMLGSLFSLTGKYWVGKKEAVDFGIGFTFNQGTALYADYLWHFPGLFGNTSQFGRETSGYLGAGGGVGLWTNSTGCGHWNCSSRPGSSGTGIFARGLAGFEWYPKPTRLGVFAEIGPTFLVAPATAATFDFGVGVRYYF